MKKSVILLIEDDELDVISVERSLKKLDLPFELHTAYNGIEAFKMLREKGDQKTMHRLPDIILLDINMPKMNGIEFLTILRADTDLKDLKVFIMTTSGEQHDRIETEKLGISGYLIKPLNYNNNDKRSDSMDGFVQFYIGKILRDDTD
ncbi:MAG TPA: response regulator [Puia sp.]|jgi:CheY-like chemotaxis protein